MGNLNTIYLLADDLEWEEKVREMLEKEGFCFRDYPQVAMLHILERGRIIDKYPKKWRHRSIKIVPDSQKLANRDDRYLFWVSKKSLETLLEIVKHFFKTEASMRKDGVPWPL